MEILLPPLNDKEIYVKDKQSIVLIGANGSGKTRMSIWIEEHNPGINVHRISAQKSLNIPESVSPSDLDKTEEKFIYGTNSDNKEWLKTGGKRHSRWGGNPETHLLNDFQQMMEYLMTEYFEESIEYRQNHMKGMMEYKNETKLETIQSIWESVVTHRKLKIYPGKIEVYDTSDNDTSHEYNASEMSDGERAIFYFIGEVVCAEKDSLIIIDEPENHLHKSILTRLWDAIENTRPDCMFLYITHNLDFAASRLNTQIIWVKNMMEGPVWEYVLLDEDIFPDPLLMEILGNRQKVLLVEGTKEGSFDWKLYSKVYPEYNVIPLESSNAVEQATKAYNSVSELNYVDVKGIIDRDRKDCEEIQKLAKCNIFVPEVSEVENLFLLPEVISLVAKELYLDNVEDIIKSVKGDTIKFLSDHIDEQALLFTRKQVVNKIEQTINQKVKTIEELEINCSNISTCVNVTEIYNKEKARLQKIVDESDFNEALKTINDKSLLSYTGLAHEFGWKENYYIEYVIRITGIKNKTGEKLRGIFRRNIGIL